MANINTPQAQPAQPEGVSFDRNFFLQMAASQGFAASQMLKGRDADNTGLDDLAGTLFQTGAEVALRYADPNMDVKNVNNNLKVAYDALGSYLRQAGVITE